MYKQAVGHPQPILFYWDITKTTKFITVGKYEKNI